MTPRTQPSASSHAKVVARRSNLSVMAAQAAIHASLNGRYEAGPGEIAEACVDPRLREDDGYARCAAYQFS